MSYEPETPFDNIENSLEYLDLLLETIAETQQQVEAETARAAGPEALRKRQALELVSYNLAKLCSHLRTSRRILNDLRTLRRLLLEERKPKTELLAASATGVAVRPADRSAACLRTRRYSRIWNSVQP